MEKITLETLTEQWLAAKARETLAKDHRVAIEEQMLKIVDCKEEGSTTTSLPDGTKITATGKLSYKVDAILLDEITNDWPEEFKPVHLALKVDETKLKHIRAKSPDMWKTIARAIEVQPAKTGITIKKSEAAQ